MTNTRTKATPGGQTGRKNIPTTHPPRNKNPGPVHTRDREAVPQHIVFLDARGELYTKSKRISICLPQCSPKPICLNRFQHCLDWLLLNEATLYGSKIESINVECTYADVCASMSRDTTMGAIVYIEGS